MQLLLVESMFLFGVSSLCCVNPDNHVFITNQTLLSSRCIFILLYLSCPMFFSVLVCLDIMTYNSGQCVFSLPIRLWFFLFVPLVLTLLYLSYLFLFLTWCHLVWLDVVWHASRYSLFWLPIRLRYLVVRFVRLL